MQIPCTLLDTYVNLDNNSITFQAMKTYAFKAIIFSLILVACEKQSYDSRLDIGLPNHNATTHTSTVDISSALMRPAQIGEKIPNPYSLDIMNEALNQLTTKSRAGIEKLEATHHYIMFKPECHAHYRSLIMQDDLDLNSFPLDHEISNGWITTNPDPAFSTNGYSHKWSYIPIERDLTNIDCPYEILYDIFYIDEEDLNTKSDNISYELFEILESKAHSICNIEQEAILQTKATDITPYGNIKYYDSSYNANLGCYGMSVKANRLTKTSYGHCDEDGNFKCDKSFKYKWTYTVYFGRTDFEIRKDTTSTEEVALVFTKQQGPLNLLFDKSSEYVDHIFYCEILRAACKYYYGEIDGLNRPPYKEDLKDRIYIQAMRGHTPSGKTLGFFNYSSTLKSIPYIRIYRDDPDTHDRQPSSTIYFCTIHELAHSAHWKVNPSLFFNNCELKVKESFATGIGIHMTRKVHPSFNYGYGNTYTGVVEDLMDTDGVTSDSSHKYIENVSGLTIAEIENSIAGVSTWSEWRDNIISLYPYNSSISNVTGLFSVWQNIF